MHHTIDTYSGFQWANGLSSEKAGSVITHLLEGMALVGIGVQTRTDSALHTSPVRCSNSSLITKHITATPHNPAGQRVVEKTQSHLKEHSYKTKRKNKGPRSRIQCAPLTLDFLNINKRGPTAAERHWIKGKNCGIKSPYILQGCVNIRMEVSKSIVLGMLICFYYRRTQKAVDCIKSHKAQS